MRPVGKFSNFFGNVAPQCHAPIWDTILYENSHFIVVPTLGSIVEQWVMIMPKARFRNFSEIASDQDIRLFVDAETFVRNTFSTLHSSVFKFEHGDWNSSVVGCGVDHAHMHYLSTDMDLLTQCVFKDHDLEWQEHTGSLPNASAASNNSYLYISECGGKSYITAVKTPTSQWFRKQIAGLSNLGDRWNYNDYFFIDNINSTINLFSEENNANKAVSI